MVTCRKCSTGARQHLVLEWSNPISRQFPTSGHEPRQVFSSKSTHFPSRKKQHVESPRYILIKNPEMTLHAGESLFDQSGGGKKQQKNDICEKRSHMALWHNPSLLMERKIQKRGDMGNWRTGMWKCSGVLMCKFITASSWQVGGLAGWVLAKVCGCDGHGFHPVSGHACIEIRK